MASTVSFSSVEEALAGLQFSNNTCIQARFPHAILISS